jgi:hypothetical protein
MMSWLLDGCWALGTMLGRAKQGLDAMDVRSLMPFSFCVLVDIGRGLR